MQRHLLPYLLTLFALFLLTQLVIVPAIGAIEAATSPTNETSLQTNLTQNATSSTTTSDFDSAGNCVHFDIRIPLPLLDQVSIFQFDLCLPKFLNDFTIIYDETGSTANDTAVATVMGIVVAAIAGIALLGITGGIAGYVTGGNSNNIVAGLAVALLLGTFMLVLLAGIFPFFSLIPVLGFAVWLFVGVVGVVLLVMSAIQVYTGG